MKNGRLTVSHSSSFNIGAMQLQRGGNQWVSFGDKRGERETEKDGKKGQPLQTPSSSDR